MASFGNNIFVTGTDTDVGKTLVAAILAVGLKGTYWKPVQSGADPETDTDWMKGVTELESDHFLPEKYYLSKPLSPHAAAQLDGIEIDFSSLRLPQGVKHRPLIIEGAGGILVPLNADYFVADMIEAFHIPTLVVARSGLGTINHTLLTLSELRRRKIDVIGVVLNGPKNESNRRAIEFYGDVRVIAEIPPLPQINSLMLRKTFEERF